MTLDQIRILFIKTKCSQQFEWETFKVLRAVTHGLSSPLSYKLMNGNASIASISSIMHDITHGQPSLGDKSVFVDDTPNLWDVPSRGHMCVQLGMMAETIVPLGINKEFFPKGDASYLPN